MAIRLPFVLGWGLFLQRKYVFWKGTDTIKCINEAIAMLGGQQGKINNTYSYFARYGNNNFFTIMLYYFFKILKDAGLRCYDEALFIVNTIMIDLSGVFALKLLKTEKGTLCACIVDFGGDSIFNDLGNK